MIEKDEKCVVCELRNAIQECGKCGAHICPSCYINMDSETRKVNYCLKCRDDAAEKAQPKRG